MRKRDGDNPSMKACKESVESAPVQRRTPTRRRAAAQPARKRAAARKPIRPSRSAKRAAESAFLDTLRPGLERDTQLMPWLIAETVCGELSRFLGVEIPARYAAWIEARAEFCYAKGGHFRKLMRGRGNAPRDWLRGFMRHWLAGLLGEERPDLYECLPADFALGHSLPVPGPNPRRRWRGDGRPLHAPRDWNPKLIAEHRHWRWLAERFPERENATECQVEALVYEFYGIKPVTCGNGMATI